MTRRLAAVLGVPERDAAVLARRARADLGPLGYWVRCAAFAAAASRPGQRLLPARVRRKALGSLLRRMLVTSADALGYLGLRPLPRGARAGRGLVATLSEHGDRSDA